jgi:hypothetical protein
LRDRRFSAHAEGAVVKKTRKTKNAVRKVIRARVQQGRLLVDEPTDLPDGSDVYLTVVEDEPWDLGAEDAAELKARMASTTRDHHVPADEVFTRLGVR